VFGAMLVESVLTKGGLMSKIKKIYVASSWANVHQHAVVIWLRKQYEVYDFRENPAFDEFSLDSQDLVRPHEHEKIPEEALQRAFDEDMEALDECHAVVLVNPCGISSHMELAWAIGRGKPGFILYTPTRPELMARMAYQPCPNITELLEKISITEVFDDHDYTF